MATMVARWGPRVVLGVVVAALVVATAQAATVTIYNPAGLVVDIQNDDKNVKIIQNDDKKNGGAVITAVMAVEISQAQQELQFSVADGEAVDVTVRDGDVLVVIPDPADDYSGNAIKAFKVLNVAYNSVVPKPAVEYNSEASIPQYDTRVFPTAIPPSTP